MRPCMRAWAEQRVRVWRALRPAAGGGSLAARPQWQTPPTGSSQGRGHGHCSGVARGARLVMHTTAHSGAWRPRDLASGCEDREQRHAGHQASE
mmetsp:Transcript_17607/g.52910  ORF Transcript_17607/g.52910 Transcript_17607/m.52910 type:complete len:94 (-) Transcript_17607:1802-2083(-)